MDFGNRFGTGISREPVHLLLGHADDPLCIGVFNALAARRLSVLILGSPTAPPASLVWNLSEEGVRSELRLGDDPVEVASVLVRGTPELDAAGWAPADHAYMQAETLASTLAWLEGLPCPVVNRPSAALFYKGRTSLLSWRRLLRRCDLLVPEQVIVSDSEGAKAFRSRLATDDVAGAVYTPFTSSAEYLVSTDAAWDALADLQDRSPVCLTEPHGAAYSACIIGNDAVWEDDAPLQCRQLTDRLIAFARLAALDFVELAIARVRGGYGVVMVEPLPVLEHFAPRTRERILASLSSRLAPARVETAAVR